LNLIVPNIVGETGPNSRFICDVDGMDERHATLGNLASKIPAAPFKKF
jgi:hypothetical protein